MSKPLLATHNALIQLESGVWVKADEAERSFIDYTDGDSSENSVYANVQAAADRSVYSEELDLPWDDWALEYHLSSRRSNIYRGLNLDGVKAVLEVGCGCGAITRFLGEQGFRVDAIEGTERRAQIARLRSEELDNVQIVSSNYHELALPEKAYDLVVFTGVLEYSGAYAPAGVSPESQLQITLDHARSALSESGQILIAIENRAGFKYLAGASEDHLIAPNIGLLEYAEPLTRPLTRGIRTWSKQEWQNMLTQFGFAAYEFCYPFPDYKVPEAILSDGFLNGVNHPEQVLGGIQSRDYTSMWWPSMSESLFWKTAAHTRTLDEYANSFLIVIANNRERIAQTIDFDFVRFASVRRKLGYRMQVVKKQVNDTVSRIPLLPQAEQPVSLVSQHHVEGERFVDGQVLEQLWGQALMVVPSYAELAKHLRVYAQWLETLIEADANRFVDAVPRNIIVDQAGVWHLIDQEWHAVEGIDRETIIFRALLYYVLHAREFLADMELGAARQGAGISSTDQQPMIQTLDDFIAWGFTELNLDYTSCRTRCVGFEAAMQKQVSGKGDQGEVEALLQKPISQSFDLPTQPAEVRAFWTQMDGVWHLDHSVTAHVMIEEGLKVDLELPQDLLTHRFLRIDPAAYVLHIFRGSLEFEHLSITVRRHSGDTQRVFNIASAEDFYSQASLSGMRLIKGERLMLTSASASIVLDLNSVDWGDDVASIQLSLGLAMSAEKNLLTAWRILREESIRSAYRVRIRQTVLEQQSERLEENEQRLAELRKKLKHNSTTTMGRLLSKLGLMRKVKV